MLLFKNHFKLSSKCNGLTKCLEPGSKRNKKRIISNDIMLKYERFV